MPRAAATFRAARSSSKAGSRDSTAHIQSPLIPHGPDAIQQGGKEEGPTARSPAMKAPGAFHALHFRRTSQNLIDDCLGAENPLELIGQGIQQTSLGKSDQRRGIAYNLLHALLSFRAPRISSAVS